MRAARLLAATSVALLLAACGDKRDFAADYAAAKANAATLEGGAFAHAVGLRMTTPEVSDASYRCIEGSHADRPGDSGVIEFKDGGGYSVRFEADDDQTDCLVKLFEGRALPEPPTRPYLIPIEAGVPE